MDLTTTLLNGESLTLSTHGSDVTELGLPLSCSVLLVDDVELEVNAGDATAADFFFTTTGSGITDSPVRLRGGQDLVTAPYGGRSDQGLAFRVDLTDGSLFGAAPPTVNREMLAAALAAAGIRPGDGGGLRLRPTGRVRWSPTRSHDMAVSATDDTDHAVLLDVRRTARGPAAGQRGRRVRGGWLSRSSPDERVHLVLEAEDAVAYGLPPTADDVALTVDVLSELEITVQPDAQAATS